MDQIMDDRTADESLAESFPAAVRALKTGDTERLKRLLTDRPALAAIRSMQGRTLLHHLCDWPGHYPGQLESARALIAAGADVNARAIDPERGETALQWAASNDDAAMAELLIDAGTPVDGLNGDGRPLAQSIWYGCPQVTELLLRRGAALDLELAAAVGRVDLLPGFFGAHGELLPAAGRHHEPINDSLRSERPCDERVEQALVYAVLGGSAEAAAWLLARGADVNARPSGFGRIRAAALHWAAGGIGARSASEAADEESGIRMAELLLDHGADTGLTDSQFGATPLGWADHFQRRGIASLLQERGAVR
ncbi:ankyrin repeat domain-containing protein [Paenibacillus humicola]|uniref:ankyrin repeat domain-containing protein n=1 Tax=Paenibacillus humicola TaxID=3110540 RepID=UPI00237BCA53|nr:ankyrin repeat domain-containing protein [Paenibacillus humicola]